MTDDRVAGLPDAGTIQPGDPGHIETHDRMAELMQFAAERIGIILDPPAPKPAVIGEYGHVDAHNTLLANIEQIAREAGTAVGGPPAPILTNPKGGSVVAFTSGGEGAAGPTIAYGAEIEPNDHGETVTVDQTNLEVAVSGTQPFTDYIVTVYGVNIAGRGESATTDAFQLNYNQATGGDVVDEYTRLSDNTRWRYHQFTTVGAFTFTVDSSPKPDEYRILVVGGGGSGGGATGGGGGGGGVNEITNATLAQGTHNGNVDNGGATQFATPGTSSIGAYTAKSGNGGQGSGNGWNGGASGAPTSNGGGSGASHEGGGGGGAGGRGSNQVGNGGGNGGAGLSKDITGNPQTYGAGGKGGTNSAGASGQGRPGARQGTVIVAYQIGTSTTRQIEQAQAEAAAREAGYATGYEIGVTDGRDQRDEEIRAAAEQVKEAVKEARPTKDKK